MPAGLSTTSTSSSSIANRERNIFGDQIGGLRQRQSNRDVVALIERRAALGGFAVQAHMRIIDQLLGVGTGDIRKHARQKAIETVAGILLADDQRKWLLLSSHLRAVLPIDAVGRNRPGTYGLPSKSRR